MGNTSSATSTVKYLKQPSTLGFHHIEDYEYARSQIHHSSYDELQAQILAHCPSGFHCMVPVARRHVLIWRMHSEEEDCLMQPIFQVVLCSSSLSCTHRSLSHGLLWVSLPQEEYASLDWSKIKSVCVHIELAS